MQEVAEGVRYIHSEEILHGNLHGVCVPSLVPYFVNQFILCLLG
jgi:hypothetical protein